MPTTQPAHVVLVLQESALLAGSSGHGKAVYGNPYSTLGLAFRPQKERRVCQGSDQHTACTVYFKCLGCVNKEGIETKRTRPPEGLAIPASGSLAKLFQLCYDQHKETLS